MKKLFSVFGGLFLGLMVCAINISAQEDNPKTISAGVVNGKAISLPKPEYPDEARKANVGGSVSVQVVIDEEGNVISATAVSGNKRVYKTVAGETAIETEEAAEKNLLYEASETAAKQAKFTPTLLEGKAVKVSGIIVYNFVTDNKCTIQENATGISSDESINGGVLNGKAINLPKPDYPDAAKQVKAGGAVTVQVVIDEEGNVISAQAVSGHPLLRQSAADAAKAAKFSPTLLKGQPVKVSGMIVYNFVP